MRILLFLILLLPQLLTAQNKTLSFSFSLPADARVSAGLYKGDVLIRTVFSNKQYTAGKHNESFEALDDDMHPITSVNGLAVKVLSNNVKYDWEGVIGNTSDSMTGNSVYHNYGAIRSMAFAGGFGYYTVGYNERKPSYGKFKVTTPNQRIIITDKRIQADYVATDGVNVYWGCSDPYAKGASFVFATTVSDDSEVSFSDAQVYKTKRLSSTFEKTIGYTEDVESVMSGFAVQQKGNYLFISRKKSNRIDVLDKVHGAIVFTINLASPGALAVDANDNLWVASNNAIRQYNIRDRDYKPLILIEGLQDVQAIAVSPDNKMLLAADAGTNQLNAFSISSGASMWVFGQKGGYTANGPEVTNDKFYFKGQQVLKTFIAFEKDGSFWVGDPGNTRSMHYSADKKYVNCIAYRPISYSTFTDLNNPKRVFSDFSEYEVDYSKKLDPHNGSWRLVRNWGAVVPDALNDKYGRLRNVMTLKNGRTYALSNDNTNKLTQVLELPSKGNLRMAGTIPNGYQLYADGSLRNVSGTKIGAPEVWKERKLKGFTSEGNPEWEQDKVIATSPPLTKNDPAPRNIRSMAEITSSGILVAYEGATPLNGANNRQAEDRSAAFHLAGIKLGEDGKWLWRTAYATNLKYIGDFPRDGSFDIGNGVVRTGDVMHHAVGKNIFYGQHGEFWKGSQVNIWNHFYDNGLLIGNFGVTGPEVKGKQAPYGMAGNILTGSIVEVNGNLYLTHNDEGHHSGVHVWKISNLASINEQTVPLSLADNKADQKNLMGSVVSNLSLQDDNTGWKRSPVTDDLSDQYRSYWQVRTNVKSHGRFEDPDIYVRFRYEKDMQASLYKNLGLNNTDNWDLTGKLNYDNNYAATNADPLKSGGQYLEILDDNGKAIFRFFPLLNYSTKVMTLVANGVVMAEDSQVKIEKITDKFQPFSFKMVNGKATFKYGPFDEKSIPLQDAGANYKTPTTVRLYFWNKNKGADRVVSIKDFKFSK